MTPSSDDRIFNIKTAQEFREIALEIFRYQYNNNKLYKKFADLLGRRPGSVKSISQIPYLPVEFFRNNKIITGRKEAEIIFESSGTGGLIPGRHHIVDRRLYQRSFLTAFSLFYGDPAEYLILALLPSYTVREGSSLVYMADRLIRESHNSASGFYKDKPEDILNAIKKGKESGSDILLLGVSFALLDLAESGSYDFSGVIVMETGGMKGRRKEITRQELHDVLKNRFNVEAIHSEYGMTELLSQAYSSGDGIFYCPPWMKIILRDPQDPLSVFTGSGKTGGINIIDLANINSCSFIGTGDLGKLHDDGGFEVIGRFDNSDIRGCNLMAE